MAPTNSKAPDTKLHPHASETDPQVFRSACPLDCPDTCTLDITVNAGQVVRIDSPPPEPGPDVNTLTQGFICNKVRQFGKHAFGEDRLTTPLRRKGPRDSGSFEPISWDQALSELTERMQALTSADKAEAILPLSYGGSNGLLSQDTYDARLFWGLGASRLARTVCAAPSTAAAKGLYGKMPGVALEDYSHSKFILVWGVNPNATGIHHVPILKRAKKAGAKLVVIDPRRIPLADLADIHLAPKPGTDLAIALSILRHLFESGKADTNFLDEHCLGANELARRAQPWTFERAAEVAGIEKEALRQVAELYAEASPAVIRCGWGVERNRNGGSAVAAILALPAVAGKFGQRGGGYTMSNGGAFRTRSAAGALPPNTREINMNQVGRVLNGELLGQGPPIELLFVYNCNPLVTLPQQNLVRAGLERDDLFTVVFDSIFTDTARFADLVLPATTFLEHRDLRKGYGAMVLQNVRPVVEPYGESRSNVDVFRELCDRAGLLKEETTGRTSDEVADELVERLLEDQSDLSSALNRGEVGLPAVGSKPIQFVDVFPNTPDQKVALVPESLDTEAPEGLYTLRDVPEGGQFPLTLISPATGSRISSTFGQLDKRLIRLQVHPDDAAERKLQTGDLVEVFNDLGQVECPLQISDKVRPGVVFLPKGLWRHNTHNGSTANALAPDFLADLGGGACFNDARVDLKKISR